MASLRINARLDATEARTVQRLAALTGASVSDLVKQGLALLDRSKALPGKAAAKRIKASGFIGAGASGTAALSTNYKKHLADYLEKKHGAR